MLLLILGFGLALTGAAGASHAQTIRGAGARPCGEWQRARAGGGRAFEAEQWALGYLSATNAGLRVGANIRILDETAIFAGIDQYCGGHPKEMLWNAVRVLAASPHSA
jgi:hypothetical protein